MTTVSLRVTASGDDVNDTSDGGYPGFSNPGAGSSQYGNFSDYDPRSDYFGWIFRSVSVASGATWDSGSGNPPTVTVNPNNSATATIDVYVGGEEDGTPNDWADTDGPPDRTSTAAEINWTFDPAADTPEESPDLDTVLQEISDTAGALTDLALWMRSNTSGSGKGTVDAYDDDSATAPLFDGDYTAGGGGGATVPIFHHHYQMLRTA